MGKFNINICSFIKMASGCTTVVISVIAIAAQIQTSY